MVVLTNKCSTAGVQPETVVGMMMVSQSFDRNRRDCFVTSCTSYAFDTSIRELNVTEIIGLIAACRRALGSQWCVTEEGYRIHFEFQPKVNK